MSNKIRDTYHQQIVPFSVAAMQTLFFLFVVLFLFVFFLAWAIDPSSLGGHASGLNTRAMPFQCIDLFFFFFPEWYTFSYFIILAIFYVYNHEVADISIFSSFPAASLGYSCQPFFILVLYVELCWCTCSMPQGPHALLTYFLSHGVQSCLL